MSLINDAIKRAGQTPTAPPNPAQTAAGMRPIEYEPATRFPWAIVIAIFIPVFGLAVWFIVKGWQLSQTPATAELIVSARSESMPALTEIEPSAAFHVPQMPLALSNLPAPIVASEPPKPAFPNLKLQGIYWRPSRPSAVINSKTVYVGDRVEAARVTGIDHETVTVQWETESKVLTLK